MISPQPLQTMPYGAHIPAQLEGDDCVGVDGGRDEAVNGGVEEEAARRSSAMAASPNSGLPSRTSELTIAFEGEVYVFPAVTPEKVSQAWLSF